MHNGCSIINYDASSCLKYNISEIEEIKLPAENGRIQWVNTYGSGFKQEFLQVVKNNKLDDFLTKLLTEDMHPNKVIELDDLLLITIRVLKTDEEDFKSEQMFFIASNKFIWSIQEKFGDHFGWIRQRLESNKGITRKKNADYLLYLILESIVDHYHDAYEDRSELKDINFSNVKPTPEFTVKVEKRKQILFKFKKASISLRDIIMKLEKTSFDDFETKYFSELKEQTNNLIGEIDFEIQELESKINLIFSIQRHRLNEVMKTLTIFSVVFIPLTFIAGIYGMNFENMPELEAENGYFILLSVMLVLTLISVWFFKKKKWF